MLLPAVLLCAFALQEPSVPTLIERLASENIEERERATNALKSRAVEALPHLRKAAAGEQGERALRVLRWIEAHKLLTPGIKKVFPGMEKALLDRDPRPWSALFLEFHLDPDPDLDEFTPLERTLICENALREADSELRVKDVFDELFAKPTFIDPTLVTPFAEKEGDLRLPAIMILAHTGGPGALKPLRELLRSEDWIVRDRASAALGILKAREAIGDLRALLPRRPVEKSAVRALGQIGAREAEPEIRALLKEKGTARTAAALALADLGAPDTPSLLAGVLLEEGYEEQTLAAERLARSGPAAVPSLRDCLKKGNDAMRHLVVDALPQAGGNEVVRDLAAALGDSSHSVRIAAVKGLLDLQAKEAIPDLRKLLKDPAPFVQIAAADALCALGDPAAAQVLLASSERYLEMVERVVPLTSLNALRQPETWGRLMSTRLEFPPEGRIRSVLNRIGKVAGLKIELSDLDSEHDTNNPWKERRLSVAESEWNPRVVNALRRARGNGAYDFILEPDRIRVVPHTEAIKFWRDWLKQRAK